MKCARCEGNGAEIGGTSFATYARVHGTEERPEGRICAMCVWKEFVDVLLEDQANELRIMRERQAIASTLNLNGDRLQKAIIDRSMIDYINFLE